MRRQYDDFTQLKIKDMSKAISDMTYQYIDPELNRPTEVPANHYEKILGEVKEQFMNEIASVQFLNIVYKQLDALRKENEKYFNQALMCMDLNLNPSDLRYNERVALDYTNDKLEKEKAILKKEFHLLDTETLKYFDEIKNDPIIQAETIKAINNIESIEKRDFEAKRRSVDLER